MLQVNNLPSQSIMMVLDVVLAWDLPEDRLGDALTSCLVGGPE